MEPRNLKITFLWSVRFRLKFGSISANGGGFWNILLHQSVTCCNVKKKIGGHQRLARIHEAIMLIFIWVIWKYRNLKAYSPIPISKSQSAPPALAYKVKSLSILWINARKRKGHNLRWFEWQCDPVMASFFSLF